MATYAVGVAVGEFFFGGFADVDNFDFKRQLFSGEGVVATKRLSSMKTSKDYQLFLRQWKLHQITDNL